MYIYNSLAVVYVAETQQSTIYYYIRVYNPTTDISSPLSDRFPLLPNSKSCKLVSLEVHTVVSPSSAMAHDYLGFMRCLFQDLREGNKGLNSYSVYLLSVQMDI